MEIEKQTSSFGILKIKKWKIQGKENKNQDKYKERKEK